MIPRIGFLLLLLLNTLVSFSYDTTDETDPKQNAHDKNSSTGEGRSVNKRVFKSLQDEKPILAFNEQNFYLDAYLKPTSSEIDEIRSKIEATYEKVQQENRFTDFLDETALLDLPIGLKVDIGVLSYTILIDSVVMTPKESFLYASMVFETPLGKRIHFLGKDIKFSKAGGITGDGKLALVGDYSINLPGKNSKLIVKGSNEKTFAEFDCKGFRQLSLDASLVFSREVLLPEDGKGKVVPEKNLSIDFTAIVGDWNDILIEVNIPKFQVSDIKDISFSVSEAVLDFSDTRNPLSVNFPEGYSNISPTMRAGDMNLWRGVYIRDLTVELPRQFEIKKDENSGKNDTTVYRASFKGNNVILDNVGFSGKITATNLIHLSKGKIGNWNFSLETFAMDVAANSIKEANFSGKIVLPLSKQVTDQTAAANGKSTFAYSAVIRPGNEYNFNVSNADTLDFQLWKADVTLNPSSYVEIKLINGKFLPKALLHGQMTMNMGLKDSGDADNEKGKNVKIAKVTFEDLQIQTIKPYVKVGKFSLGSEGGDSGMGGFPIQVKSISGGTVENNIFLSVELTLSLVGEGDGGFAAEGKFKIIAEGVEKGRDLSYRFKKLELERFSIDIDKGPFKFKGTLNFYKQDVVYGNGISGTVDATFQPGFKIQASAIFGTRNGTRYWFVDAMLTLPTGIPVFPPVALYSFGGGAFYHMKIDTEGVGSELGRTVSGIVYVPEETIGFGLKATVGIGLVSNQNTFNADVTFEMAFNRGGGLRYINFRGNGYFISSSIANSVSALQEKVQKLAAVAKKAGAGLGNLNDGSGGESAAQEVYGAPGDSDRKAMIWASAMIHFDFGDEEGSDPSLHGNFKAYMNIAGIIKGAGPDNRVGEVVFHIDRKKWYVYIGRPEYENRIAVEVLGIARMDSYFVLGSFIPDTPPPPQEVSDILGKMDLDYMRDLNALADGAGIGFGASFKFDTGNISFMMFYARFRAGFGFDIMLKDYGDVYCKGGKKLGINGWYANSQAYAYFEGKIGIRVKIFGKRKKVNILEIGAAVVMQAKLPNPVWMRGIVGGRFRALGGLVKGSCKFEVKIGKECEVIREDDSSILETVNVLAQTTPHESEVEVDPFTVPQAIFNFEMEREYEMIDVQDNVVKFKITLDAFTLKHNGAPVKTELIWNDDKTVAALNPFEILPSEQELVLEVVTSFKERKNGQWIVTTVEGEKLTKAYTIKFKTGLAPDHIPANNVLYSYPTAKQFNYYKDESPEGYIKLKQGQSYLFASSTEWDQVMRFKTKSGQSRTVPFTYVSASKEVRLVMPRNLSNDIVYEMSVVNIPKGFLHSVDANVTTASLSIMNDSIKGELDIQSRSAEGSLKEVEETILYTINFRTSRYNTLREKVVSVNPSSGWRDPILPGIHNIGSNISGPEPFSYEEIYGSPYNEPLVQMEADLSNVPWYQNDVYPIVYQDYPLQGTIRLRPAYNRDPSVLGLVPTKAVDLYQYPYNFVLTEEAITNGTLSFSSPVGRIDYRLAHVMYNDFLDLAGQAANYVVAKGSNPRLDRLLTSTFPAIRKGNYGVKINYVLPGRNTVSSTYNHKIYNPID
jgi:hypothetical protein